ncbi:hypothetical protein [Agrobacterium vitis]|uniref:hypothetical protein n=1 Tax=Agrobacterium vitis TaxID=373 RepID=UPI0012E8730C|nr:hypothetical protein [Agrobacterium vitis]MUZ61775.1 hypothetical protein [Agrobacterium vitis]MVA21469.1 hypothetical protein [Agrobacterium vitis]MVA62209.1 hypothetical protein [Agrobacterium vitis]
MAVLGRDYPFLQRHVSAGLGAQRYKNPHRAVRTVVRIFSPWRNQSGFPAHFRFGI